MLIENVEILLTEVKVFLDSSYWLTPTNLHFEKEKFLDSNIYNPVLKYPNLPYKRLNSYLGILNSISIKDNNSFLSYIYRRKIDELKIKIQLLLNRGKENLSNFSMKLYKCWFNKKILDEAKLDSKIPAEFKRRENLSVNDVVAEMRSYLAEYKIVDWTVEVSDDKDFYVRVNSNKKLILVSVGINWDFSDLDGLLAHEIDGHVLRAINSEKQKVNYKRKPFPFYIKTEEGLSSYLEDYHSSSGEIGRKHHAIKYLAGKLALTSSFREVFDFLTASGFTNDLAFQRAFRLKRGFEDTSKPGVYAREAVYYEGMMEVKNYVEQGRSLDLLYSAKAGLEDLKYVSKVKGVIIPRRLEKLQTGTWSKLMRRREL